MPFKERSDDIIIRIPRKLYTKELQNMLNLFRHKKLVSKSKMTEKKLEAVFEKIKKEREKKVKQLLKSRGITVK